VFSSWLQARHLLLLNKISYRIFHFSSLYPT
jgi:hypothetical protein